MSDLTKLVENLENSLNEFSKKFKPPTKEEIIEKIKNRSICIYNGTKDYYDDYDVMLEIFVESPSYINYDHFKFKENEKFFLEAIKRPGSNAVNYWKFFPELTKDQNIFKEVIKIKPSFYKGLIDDLKEDRAYNVMLIEEGADIFQYLNNDFQGKIQLVMMCLKNGKPTEFFVHEDLEDYRPLFYKLAELFDTIPEKWISFKLLTDKKFIKKIEKINPRFFDKISVGKLKEVGGGQYII